MTDLSVQFLSFDTIDYHARQVLEVFQPEALCRPVPIDARGLVESYLPRIGVGFTVADEEELGTCEGLTEIYDGQIDVFLREDQWAALLGGGEPALRPRATIAHELGHVVLHADYALRRAELTKMLTDGVDVEAAVVALSGRGDVEWQAWAFAGCLMMPVEIVRDLEDFQPRSVGRLFNVSPQFAMRHMLRMKREGLL